MNRSRALVLLAVTLIACRETYDVQRDVTLKAHLTQMRAAIARYRADNGSYPPSLAALTPHYLPSVPADPFTQQPNWRLTTEETVVPSADFTTGASAAATSVVVDVHSAAPGADRDGVLYANY